MAVSCMKMNEKFVLFLNTPEDQRMAKVIDWSTGGPILMRPYIINSIRIHSRQLNYFLF
jgi:hypothetical protein